MYILLQFANFSYPISIKNNLFLCVRIIILFEKFNVPALFFEELYIRIRKLW